MSSPAGDATAGTRLPHPGGRTGLSRPLPGPYWFFPVGMPCLSPRAHDRDRGDSSWHHSDHHRHVMRSITGMAVDSALHQLAFSKSTPKCSCIRLRSRFRDSFHLPANQSTLSLGPLDCSVMSAATTFGLFPISEERFNDSMPIGSFPSNGSVQSIFSPPPCLSGFISYAHLHHATALS
jgi:hypothetical protein